MRRQQNPNRRSESSGQNPGRCPMQNSGSRAGESPAVIMPPGCDIPPDYDLSVIEEYDVYTAAEYSLDDAGDLPALPHGMTGSVSMFSVPSAEDSCRHVPSLSEYLDQYKGKNICLDLWTRSNTKNEKCGILQEVGTNFLSIRSAKSKSLTVVDLSHVKYISVYCL